MKIALWIVQIVLALIFIVAGAAKVFAYNRFVASTQELAGQHALATFIGIAELAGAAGLILPRLTGILPVLTAWAAAGLGLILVLATGYHLDRGELSHAVLTVVLLALACFVIYGRGFRNPATSS